MAASLFKPPHNIALDLTPSRSLRSLRGRKSAQSLDRDKKSRK